MCAGQTGRPVGTDRQIFTDLYSSGFQFTLQSGTVFSSLIPVTHVTDSVDSFLRAFPSGLALYSFWAVGR